MRSRLSTGRRVGIALFCIVLFSGIRGKMSGTAAPGSYTALYDTSAMVTGATGAMLLLLWPAKKNGSGGNPNP